MRQLHRHSHALLHIVFIVSDLNVLPEQSSSERMAVCFLLDDVRSKNAYSAQFGHSRHYDRVRARDRKLQPCSIQRGRRKVNHRTRDVRHFAGIFCTQSDRAICEIVTVKMNVYELIIFSLMHRVLGDSLTGPGVHLVHGLCLQHLNAKSIR